MIVGVAHGLDLVTFLMALAAFGISGESNGLMQTNYLHGGQASIVAVKRLFRNRPSPKSARTLGGADRDD